MAERPKRGKPKKLDNNNEEASKGGSSKHSRRGRHFPVLLHKGICQAAKERPDVIKWSKDGKAVLFEDKHPDLGLVLQQYLNCMLMEQCCASVETKYFAHSSFLLFLSLDTRFDSLRRQMNVFGWKKARSGP